MDFDPMPSPIYHVKGACITDITPHHHLRTRNGPSAPRTVMTASFCIPPSQASQARERFVPMFPPPSRFLARPGVRDFVPSVFYHFQKSFLDSFPSGMLYEPTLHPSRGSMRPRAWGKRTAAIQLHAPSCLRWALPRRTGAWITRAWTAQRPICEERILLITPNTDARNWPVINPCEIPGVWVAH